jgi:hypothetical protein
MNPAKTGTVLAELEYGARFSARPWSPTTVLPAKLKRIRRPFQKRSISIRQVFHWNLHFRQEA